MIVPAKPKLEFESFYSKASQISKPWDGAIFFRNGREALISALKELYIPTQSKIVIPAYICNSIPETLLRYGYKPIFLDVTTELNFSINKLKEIINNQEIKAVILVDYFGFITKMNIQQSKIIKELGVNVIVDRCHSSLSSMEELFSSNSVDAVIYSIRKTLPVRDGGALILNTNNRVNYSSNSNGMHKDLWFIISRYIERFICTIGFPNIYADWITHLRIKLDGKYRKYREIKNDTHKNISEIERGKSWLLKN